ncbi:unnamed protein product [Rhizoctonia solani]|uniref:Phosphoglycerate mutase-like protein n=1 Tax=Rhizoctonia solani TaxID=456999 RepID=A0A8H2W6A2_9AGAM|nr:unnamed protein product [Rhizoctonia solani]
MMSRNEDEEIEMLLPGQRHSKSRFGTLSSTASRSLYFLSFALGVLACITAQAAARSLGILPIKSYDHPPESLETHFPPAYPTNWNPSLFPPNVGYPGPTPTGAEPAVLATASAYPTHVGAAGLVPPTFIMGTNRTDGFELFKTWGSLSPWYSVNSAEFGLPGARARYPTYDLEWGQPRVLSEKLESVKNINATGQLRFLNDWTYKLGSEILTPFGRGQLYDLGVSMRMRYGHLLNNFTDSNTIPVFRTESENRMLESSINFAYGFFGNPIEGQYQQVIMTAHSGFNNTISPYATCPNANDLDKAYRGLSFAKQWGAIYLKDAVARFKSMAPEVDWSHEDAHAAQKMCTYETVALGYSEFCGLFTKEEWEGFDYFFDLLFWYNDAYGSPIGQALGLGWVSELVARLTHTPIEVHNTTTNATMHDSIRFPLNQSIYVDSTHETVFLNIMTTLNLTNFASDGQLPLTHILRDRRFKSSKIASYAVNMQVQLLSCASHPEPQIRLIINDGVTPLTTVRGCPQDKDGMCPLDTFVNAQKETIRTSSFDWACYGDWKIKEGWSTTRGMPPAKPKNLMP